MAKALAAATSLLWFPIAQMCQAAVITGTVVDDFSQTPLTSASWMISGPQLVTGSQATEDGRFQTGDLAPGDYFIVAGGEGYLRTSVTVHVASTSGGDRFLKPLLIRLVRLGAITGRVDGLRGRSASVMALVWSNEPAVPGGTWKPVFESAIACCGRAAPRRGVSVDSNGDFRIQRVPPGLYALFVAFANSQPPGDQDGQAVSTPMGLIRFPDANKAFELGSDGSAVSVAIAVPDAVGRTIEGRVDLPDSRSWYWLTLSSVDQPALSIATITSDENGGFAFRGVVPGSYELLAVPGVGERGTRPDGAGTPHDGFARVAIDLRERDSPGLIIAPAKQIAGTFALRESTAVPKLSTSCRNAIVTLTPLEDWGADLEQKREQVSITSLNLPQFPVFMPGLAPARYGVGAQTITGCRLRSQTVLDLAKATPAPVEGQVMEPGTIRGHVGLPDPQSGDWEVVLIPDDFTEGLSFLPANWFTESDTGQKSGWGWGAFWGTDGPGWLPYVRIATVSPDGSFEFRRAQAGHYRVTIRPADSAMPNPKPVAWRDLKRIELLPIGTTEVDLALPHGPPLPPARQ